MKLGFNYRLAIIAALIVSLAGGVWTGGGSQAQSQGPEKITLGMVSIDVNDSGNARTIQGATERARELGWEVIVIDAHGNADEANAAIQNLVTRGCKAIIDLVFPVTSLGMGLRAAEQGGAMVGTWGGGIGGSVAVTNGSGGLFAIPIVDQMIADMGGRGSILALTYHTGQVAREREEVLDKALANYPNIKVTKNEVRIPGYTQDGADFAAAWLAAHPRGSEPLAIWGSWDDPALGAIASMRQQGRNDVKVYGQNGNVDAVVAVEGGWMTATAWEAAEEEGRVLVDTLKEALETGKSWTPVAKEVPPVVVNNETVKDFIAKYPWAAGR
jgi:ribose transport system substrate-binding protein